MSNLHFTHTITDSPDGGGIAAEPSALRLKSPLADDPVFADVLAGFVSRLPSTGRELKLLVAKKETEQLTRRVHQLKGAAGSYGFTILGSAAASLEQRLRAGASAGDVSSGILDLIALMRCIDGYDVAREAENPINSSAAA